MPARTRTVLIIAVAAVAGIIAGVAAVYVRLSADGNGAPVLASAVNCDAAASTAAKIAPLAKGEVAAFQVADKPDSFGDLTFITPDGKAADGTSLAGKLTLVNLWATWCVPCRAEMPALGRLQAALGGANFTVTAINMDVSNPAHARQFLSDVGVSNLAFYSDPNLSVLDELKRRGLTIGLPTTLLLDAKGCRIGVMEGPAEWDSADAKALISAALPVASSAG